MADNFIPDDVEDFIARHIDSIAQLEALLILRAFSDERWDVATLSKRLYINEAETASILSGFCLNGFVSVSGDVFQYACDDEQKRLTIDSVAHTYSKHLIPLTQIVHAKSNKIRQFSEAFKFKRDT